MISKPTLSIKKSVKIPRIQGRRDGCGYRDMEDEDRDFYPAI